MNPRTLASISAGLAVILGIVAANLWRELHSSRETIAALQTRLAGSNGQPRVQLPAPGVDAGIAPPAQNADAQHNMIAPQSTGATAITVSVDASEQELLKDPEFRGILSKASTYATALAQAGVPLDDTQTRTVVKAMRDESEQLKQDIVALARSVDLANPHTQVRAQDALKRRQEQSNQRILSAVYPWLTAEQMRVLREQIEQQNTRRTAASALAPSH